MNEQNEMWNNNENANAGYGGMESGPQKPKSNGKSVASLVLGLVGLVAWCLPLIGFPVTIVGLIMGILGVKERKNGMAIAGIVLSAITLVITVFNSALGAYLSIMGWM